MKFSVLTKKNAFHLIIIISMANTSTLVEP